MECTHLQDKVALICFGWSEIANLQLATHIKIYLNNNFIPKANLRPRFRERCDTLADGLFSQLRNLLKWLVFVSMLAYKKCQVLHVTYE